MKKKPEPNSLIFGDSLDVLKEMPSNIFSAVVTDPPYGLSSDPDMNEVLKCWMRGENYVHKQAGFMGREWDSFVPGPKLWVEIMRVLKPGGHILSFSGTRTYDLMVLAMRLAGAEVRDKMDYHCEMTDYQSWVYGQGFPKSLDISKAMDKAAGAEREVVGKQTKARSENGGSALPTCGDKTEYKTWDVTAPATEEAKDWDGYGTALKPAHEPVAVFTKGEGQLNAEAPFMYMHKVGKRERNRGCKNLFWRVKQDLSYEPIEEEEFNAIRAENKKRKGEDGFEPQRIARGNIWPTVKPIELMRYMVRMVKMPGENLILEPFMGSGTTPVACILEKVPFVGIDRDPVAFKISQARVRYFKLLGRHAMRGLK